MMEADRDFRYLTESDILWALYRDSYQRTDSGSAFPDVVRWVRQTHPELTPDQAVTEANRLERIAKGRLRAEGLDSWR